MPKKKDSIMKIIHYNKETNQVVLKNNKTKQIDIYDIIYLK